MPTMKTCVPVHTLHSALPGCGRSRAHQACAQAEVGRTAAPCLTRVSQAGVCRGGLRTSRSSSAEAGGWQLGASPVMSCSLRPRGGSLGN